MLQLSKWWPFGNQPWRKARSVLWQKRYYRFSHRLDSITISPWCSALIMPAKRTSTIWKKPLLISLYKAQRLPPSSQIQLVSIPKLPVQGNIWLLYHGSPSVVHLCFREYAVVQTAWMPAKSMPPFFQAICNRDKEEGTRLISLHVQTPSVCNHFSVWTASQRGRTWIQLFMIDGNTACIGPLSGRPVFLSNMPPCFKNRSQRAGSASEEGHSQQIMLFRYLILLYIKSNTGRVSSTWAKPLILIWMNDHYTKAAPSLWKLVQDTCHMIESTHESLDRWKISPCAPMPSGKLNSITRNLSSRFVLRP